MSDSFSNPINFDEPAKQAKQNLGDPELDNFLIKEKQKAQFHAQVSY